MGISSLDTVVQLDIATVFTPVAGIRNVEFTAPEPECTEIDDISSTFVDMLETGRSSGGGITFSRLLDPAAATSLALVALINTPAMKDWKIIWPNTGATTQALKGHLKKLTRKADRGEALTEDNEIVTARLPVVV